MAGNAPFVPVIMAARSVHDVREMSFQTVVDKILQPAGLKMGGFPEDIFIDLSEEEQQSFMCNICYLIANDIRLCDNKHVFCHSCVLAWSMTYGENANKCPMCRCDQPEYCLDKDLESRLSDKRVQCRAENCSFKAPLRIFLMHSHGKTLYSNAHVDFARLHVEQSQLAIPPLFALADDDGSSGRAAGIREQLLQGRMMIHQMMLLMHLEMQLRQQALTSYQEAQDPELRLQRLDDVMALNEQLNEVGGILSTLLSVPLARGGATQHAAAAAAAAAEVGTGLQMPDSGITIRGSGRDGRFIPRTSHLVERHGSDIEDDEISSDDTDTSDDDGGGVVSDENLDSLPFEAADEEIVPSRYLDRDEPHRAMLVGRRRLDPDDEVSDASRQSLGTALSAINAEMRRQAPRMMSDNSPSRQHGSTPPVPIPPQSSRASLDVARPRRLSAQQTPTSPLSSRVSAEGSQQSHHVLHRRQEVQATLHSSQTPVNAARRNDVSFVPEQQSHQSQLTLPEIVPQADMPSPTTRGQPRNEVARAPTRLSEHSDIVAAGNQSNTTMRTMRSSFDSSTTTTTTRSRDQPSARELSRSGTAARQTFAPTTTNEYRPGPVTEPWPASGTVGNDLSASSSRLMSSNNRDRRGVAGLTGRVRNTNTSQTVNHTRQVTVNALPVRRQSNQPGVGRRPVVEPTSSVLQRRSSNWPVVRSLSRDTAGGDTDRPPMGRLVPRPPAAPRTQMMPLSNPARGNRVGGLAGSRQESSLRPRRRSEIVHELLFPPTQREN